MDKWVKRENEPLISRLISIGKVSGVQPAVFVEYLYGGLTPINAGIFIVRAKIAVWELKGIGPACTWWHARTCQPHCRLVSHQRW